MRGFLVVKDTKVRVIKEGKEWYGSNFVDHVCKQDNMFFTEDIRIDPVGILGPCKNGVTVGGSWAKAGWYGFENKGYVMMVPASKVTVL